MTPQNVKRLSTCVALFAILALHGLVVHGFLDIVNGGISYLMQKIVYPFGTKQLDNDGYLTTPELATKHGYRCEEHTVVTEDGYILKIHRITGRINGPSLPTSAPTILFLHGILSSSAAWILDGVNSAGGILSDQGFDVWLINSRGTSYGRNHTTLDPNSRDFWSFTYTEMIQYDFVAYMDYILAHTGKGGLHVIGYSQGGFISAGALAYKEEYNSRVKSFTLMASTLAPKATKYKPLVMFLTYAEQMAKGYGLLPYNSELNRRTRGQVESTYKFCNQDSIGFDLCKVMNFPNFGGDLTHFNISRYPYYVAIGDSISSNQLIHLSQCYGLGFFCLFDYEPVKNLKVYGQRTTPRMDFSKFTAPKFVIYGSKDVIAPKDAVKATLPLLNNVKKVVEVEGYHHIHFQFSDDIKEKVYDPIADYIKRYE